MGKLLRKRIGVVVGEPATSMTTMTMKVMAVVGCHFCACGVAAPEGEREGVCVCICVWKMLCKCNPT